MREAIERVIAELEERKKFNDDEEAGLRRDGFLYMQGVCSGRSMAYGAAVIKLKEVLNTDVPTSNRQTSSSGTDDTTK